MKLVSKLLTNLKMREMKLVSILISYIMLKNYQTHQEKSSILSIGVIHTKGLRDVIYTPLTIHTSLVVTQSILSSSTNFFPMELAT